MIRDLAAGAVFLSALIAANIVAAGVFAVLGPLALEIDDELYQLLVLMLVGAMAVLCALVFLKGCVRVLVDQLQCRAGRRGG